MNVIQHNKEGELHYFSVQATEQEVGVLINIALAALVSIGQMEDVADTPQHIDLETINIDQFYLA